MRFKKTILITAALILAAMFAACGPFLEIYLCKVAFDSDGGEEVSSIVAERGETIKLPSAERGGYVFDGWYDSYGYFIGGGGENYVVAGGAILYAHWTQNGIEQTYSLFFDGQGGSSSDMADVPNGTTIKLPATSRDGYTFDGWYTSATGGTRVGGSNGSYVVNSSITLYAHWTLIGGGGGDYEGETRTIKGIECVLVKAGTFMMGSDDSEDSYWGDARPPHEVTITKDYWVSKYPVTQGQYKSVIGTNPSYSGYGIGDDYPVNMVSWDESVAFCNAVGGRLLTEAEWEFAARGGNKSKGYIYSGSNNINDVAWYSSNSGSTSHPVGQKLPNELGIYDMSGNVWEWVNDWYDSYPSGSLTDPTGPSSGSSRVNRGGSWNYGSPYCRVANRNPYSPSFRYNNLGLRVAFNSN